MESHGTGGNAMEIQHRVDRLEDSVSVLSEDAKHTQAALAGVAAQVGQMQGLLSDISHKLDAHRTQKPNMHAIIAGLTLIMVIGGLVMAPVYKQLDRVYVTQQDHTRTLSERAGVIERFTGELQSVHEDVERLEDLHITNSEQGGLE